MIKAAVIVLKSLNRRVTVQFCPGTTPAEEPLILLKFKRLVSKRHILEDDILLTIPTAIMFLKIFTEMMEAPELGPLLDEIFTNQIKDAPRFLYTNIDSVREKIV